MKTTLLTIATLSALALLATACTADEPGGGASAPAGVQSALSVTSVLRDPGTGVEIDAHTRAEVLLPLEAGSIGVFRSQGTGYTSALNNKKYTYSAGNGWQPAATTDSIMLNGDNANVCAYYPYNADTKYASSSALPLVSGKYTGTDVAHDPNDLCYDYNRALNAYSRKTEFKMKHAMALMELLVGKDELLSDQDMTLTSVSAVNAASATVNITASTPTYGSVVAGTVTCNPADNDKGVVIPALPGRATPARMLLVPLTPASTGTVIGLTVNGNPLTATIPTTDIAKIEAGVRYRVKITVTPVIMQVTGVDILPWTDVTVGGDDHVYNPDESI